MTSLILPEARVNTNSEESMNCHQLGLREKRRDHPATREPIQQATCTDGPSFPTDKPEAMIKGYPRLAFTPSVRTRGRTKVRLLIKNVPKPRKPFMLKPARIHLILRFQNQRHSVPWCELGGLQRMQRQPVKHIDV